jgi:HK97 gp10 family phage protein
MITIKANGLDAVIQNFENLATETKAKTNKALDAFGQGVVRDAVTLVSANSSDEGLLKNSIKSEVGTLNVRITAATNYAAYIEFGTRKFAASYVSSLPADWQSFAGTFRGKGDGDFKQFLISIMGWCGRKGIDKSAAYPIAMKILREGIRPKPYLYPSIKKRLPVLEKDIEDIFK